MQSGLLLTLLHLDQKTNAKIPCLEIIPLELIPLLLSLLKNITSFLLAENQFVEASEEKVKVLPPIFWLLM